MPAFTARGTSVEKCHSNVSITEHSLFAAFLTLSGLLVIDICLKDYTIDYLLFMILNSKFEINKTRKKSSSQR